MATGGIHAPMKDSHSRPITAGGFVDDAPVVFVDITHQAGIDKFHQRSGSPEKSTIIDAPGSGVALLDYDNDGRLDAVVTTNDGPAHILHNETPTQNHWLKLKLVGHKSNRDAIGAEVKLVTAKGQQCATLSTAGSYLSSSDKRVHFGLGRESVAQSIEIRWPSGITQTLKNIRADQILTVDEPSPSAGQK